MQSAPDDPAMRAVYLQQLDRIAHTHVGLCEARLPELPYPLLLRCGTTDVDNLGQIFFGREFDFPFERPPARILDLGAYVGYVAVFLANRFPEAQILCVEPVPASFRMLMLNTLPYRNITHLNAAAWSRSGRLRVAAMPGGDWGHQLAEAPAGEPGGYPCHTVAEILSMRGWAHAEFVKCDIERAEAALFADPTAEWIGKLDVLAVGARDQPVAGSAETLAACFDASLFTHARHGNLEVYQRRQEARPPAKPPVIPLIHAGPALSSMQVRNAPAEIGGFFLFEDRGCQLHPNAPGEPPARVVFTLDCQGQNRFTTVIFHAGQPADDIAFRAKIRRLSDGAVMLDGARRVLAGVGGEWSEPIPMLIGRHEVILETEMAPEATSHVRAWARWIDPRLG